MRRHAIEPREDWARRIEALGLLFHENEGAPSYWNEAAYYELTEAEVDVLETATNELHRLCLEAAQHVLDHDRLGELGIPSLAHAAIRSTWEGDAPSLYGRFDLSYAGGDAAPKMLEYNADTPTSLLEAAVVQWHWLTERFPEADQFNSIWEGLVERWRGLKHELGARPVSFAHVESLEDEMTVNTLRDAAHEAGIATQAMLMEDIGWDGSRNAFVDLEDEPITVLFKLYPWEFMAEEAFAVKALDPKCATAWIEPCWKMILSNKAILPILWELFPDHPNLLPAYADGPRELIEWVRKPRLGREGANILVRAGAESVETVGEYGAGAYVWQAYAPLPSFDGQRPVVGSWTVDGEARGIGIRETDGPVTHNLSRFVPHLFR